MAFDWKGLVAKIAPALSWALPGPLGDVAKGVIANALGVAPGDEKELVAKMAGATPEHLLALKAADADFALKLKSLGLDYERAANEDRANARAREIATKDWTTRGLGLFATAVYAAVVVSLFYVPIPTANRDAVMAAFGILSSTVGMVYTYYFGSSAGSVRKTEMLGEAQATK